MWLLMAGLLGLVAPVTDLQATGQQAREAGLPILLYVSRSDCTFCRRFEAHVLNPLLRSGAVADTIIVRELVWDLPGPVTDFAGEVVAPESIADGYGAKLTPTLLFLDAHGDEIASRITGYRESDYFSYYLEAAAARAHAAIKRASDADLSDGGR